ncbi:maestro heat-like repeat-containing protein family member 7, partial [Cyanistes caeruleus]|uniref:maestro heat-like repeat-containing protein family member 7 n=1 Tax=Cyanistes caeruleus TaxID=156563 RepID=UPI000CDB4C7D
MDQTQEQGLACGLFHRTAQEETSVMGTGSMEDGDVYTSDTSAAMLEFILEEGVSIPEQLPAVVRYIHQWLMANESADSRLGRTLLDLTKAQPTDVVIALLRVAPVCDRAAMTMWKTIMCSSRTVEPVVQILLDVLRTWPEHSTCTSDGDNTGVFALAATVVMWKFLRMPCIPCVLNVYFPRLFVHLVFQVLFSTLEMPQEVDTFWKACQEQHGLAISPNRFAVQILKSLLCLLRCKHVVVEMEHKRGWDMLLCADTHHHAVGLLAREMCSSSIQLCSGVAFYLLRLLSKELSLWDFAALAFLVEILDYLDLSECCDSILDIMSQNLQSECRERHCLALRGLLVLAKNPSMAKKMWSLTESLLELLQEDDSDVVRMTIVLLKYLFLYNSTPIASPIAQQLAEVLLALFDNDDSQVQLVSMFVFQKMIDLFMEEGRKALKSHVHQSLLPLFFHCHDENQQVAEASRETLHSSARFLRRRDIEQMLEVDQTWRFGECLVRTAWKAQPQPGEAPCPWRSVHGAGSWAPAQCRSRGHTASSPGSCGPEPAADG